MFVYVLALGVVGLLTLLELRRGGRIDRNRLFNLANWAFRISMALALMRFMPVVAPYSLINLSSLPWLVQFSIYFATLDLAEYLFHRAQHSLPFLWALHSLHHSDPDMNATTTERHHWGDQFIKAATIYPAVTFLFAGSPSVTAAYVLAALWNFVCHSNLPLNFGRFSWVLNGPAYHRRHHSSLPEHYNSNFAALLPLWDVISGSYHRPDGFPPTGLEVAPERFVDAATWPFRIAATVPSQQ